MSDEHIASIVAFLRSDDPIVAPQPVPDRESERTLLMKMLATFVFEPFAYPDAAVQAPSIDDEVAYGKYLVDELLDCYGCHSADWTTIDTVVPENSEGYLGGGNTLVDFDGRRVYTANITFDEETGIGSWTRDDLARAVREGFRPDGSAVRYPMERWNGIIAEDDYAPLVAYVRELGRASER